MNDIHIQLEMRDLINILKTMNRGIYKNCHNSIEAYQMKKMHALTLIVMERCYPNAKLMDIHKWSRDLIDMVRAGEADKYAVVTYPQGYRETLWARAYAEPLDTDPEYEPDETLDEETKYA